MLGRVWNNLFLGLIRAASPSSGEGGIVDRESSRTTLHPVQPPNQLVFWTPISKKMAISFTANVKTTVWLPNRILEKKNSCFVAERSMEERWMKPVGRQSDWELSIRTADRGRSCGKARQIFVDKETNICWEEHQIFAYKENKHLHAWNIISDQWKFVLGSMRRWTEQGVRRNRWRVTPLWTIWQGSHSSQFLVTVREDEMCSDNSGFCHLCIRLEHLDSL